MKRSNIVFGVLILMLGGLVASFWLRPRAGHVAPASLASAEPASRQTKPPKKQPAEAPSASAAASAAMPEKEPGPLLDRPLSVTALGWHLAAPLIVQNDGLKKNPKGAFSKRRLDVRIAISESPQDVENALARGGSDEKGADVAVMPLPEFVASYEALKALDPVMFLIAGWSSGRAVLLSKFKSMAELAKKEPIFLKASKGSSEMFLAAFALQATGANLENIVFEPADDEKPDPELWALTRDEIGGVPEGYEKNVLLSSAEALQLIPYVAVAQRAFVEARSEALVTFAEVWFAGQARVTQEPTATARRLAKLDKGPEPLALLGQLGQVKNSSFQDNALSAGVAGRGAVNLTTLFDHCWRYFRKLRVLSTPPPVTTPVTGDVIARLILTSGPKKPSTERDRDPPLASASESDTPPLLVLDSGSAKRTEAELVSELGFNAGVFARSTLRFAVYKNAAYDKKLTEELARQTSERFALAGERLVPHRVKPTSQSNYLIEVMPVQ